MYSLKFPGCAPWPMTQGYGHGERIFDITFHPFSDDIVLTASEDTSLRLWNRPMGSTMYKQVRAFLGHSGEALRACWSANGLLLASGSADRTVRLWASDLNEQGYSGRQLAVLDGHPEEVYHVELLDPSRPPSIPAAPPPQASRAPADGVHDVMSSPPPPDPLPPFETHVLAASSESLFVWSLQEGAVVQQADAPGTSGSTITQEAIMSGARPAYIFGVSRQPGGSLLAAVCCDGAVRLWSLRPTGQLQWAGQVPLPGQPMCTGCAFAADGARLGVTTREGRLIELDVRTMELLTSRQAPASPLTLAYMPAASCSPAGSNTEMWLVACRDGAVYGYALEQAGDEPATVIRPPSGPGVSLLAVAVAQGGTAVALGGELQDVAQLPAMRQPPTKPTTDQRPETLSSQPPPVAPTSAQATTNPSSGGSDTDASRGASAHTAATGTAAAEPAAGSVASSAPAAPEPSGRPPAAVVAAAVAAPARRRGGAGRPRTAGVSFADAGGDGSAADPLGPLGPLGGGCGGGKAGGGGGAAREERRQDVVTGQLEAMALGSDAAAGAPRPSPSSQHPPPEALTPRQQQRPAASGAAPVESGPAGATAGPGGRSTGASGPNGGGTGSSAAVAVAMAGQGDVNMGDAAAGGGGAGASGLPGRQRAALFVYRGVVDW